MNWTQFIFGVVWSPAIAAAMWRWAGRTVPLPVDWFVLVWTGTASLLCGILLIIRAWSDAAGFAVSLIAAILYWLYRRWRDRHPAGHGLGYKARAALARMRARMREARPRPVRIPQPQGAGA